MVQWIIRRFKETMQFFAGPSAAGSTLQSWYLSILHYY